MNTDAVTQQKNWNGKPYHSLDHMLRERFGEKVYKVTLNGGMSCPNRDGKLGSRGCIFCSAGGSGDFAADAELSVTEQIDSQIALLSTKRPIHKYIAYFRHIPIRMHRWNTCGKSLQKRLRIRQWSHYPSERDRIVLARMYWIS